MSNLVFLKDQPGYHTRLVHITPVLTTPETITASIDGYPRNVKIIVALDADRILIRCTDITLSRWITAHDIITPRRFGGVA